MTQCEMYPKNCNGRVELDPTSNKYYCKKHFYTLDNMVETGRKEFTEEKRTYLIENADLVAKEKIAEEIRIREEEIITLEKATDLTLSKLQVAISNEKDQAIIDELQAEINQKELEALKIDEDKQVLEADKVEAGIIVDAITDPVIKEEEVKP